MCIQMNVYASEVNSSANKPEIGILFKIKYIYVYQKHVCIRKHECVHMLT
jgi:hypothetical protein